MYAWPTLDPDIFGTPEPTPTQSITEYDFIYCKGFYDDVIYPPETLLSEYTEGVTIRLAGRSFGIRSTEAGQYYTSSWDVYYSLYRATAGTLFSVKLQVENYTSENIYVQLENNGVQEIITLAPSSGITEIKRDTITSPGSATLDFTATVYVSNSRGAGNIDYRIVWGGECSEPYRQANETSEWIWYQSNLPGTMPEAGDGYCSTVISEDEIGQGDEDTFQLPGINIGVADCITMAGITVPLDWTDTWFGTGWEDWNLQGIEVCFTPIDFGSLSIFGIRIDLDLIALAMAGVLLIRLITRS